MKQSLRILLLGLVFAVLAAGLVFAYLKMRGERDLEASAEAPVIAPSRVTVTPAGATVRLDLETQRRLGVQIAVLNRTIAPDEVTAGVRVLDGANLSELLAEVRAAEAAFEATRSDHERKRKLAESGQNTSASAVETAMAAMKKEEINLGTARAKVVAAWGPALAARRDLAALAESLLRREQAIVRIELLVTDRLDTPPKHAALERLDGFGAAAEFLGPAPSSENPLSGRSLLYLVPTQAEALVPGTILTARLARAGNESAVWLVPRGAVLRYAGLGWIYVQRSEEMFVRHEIALDRAHANGWVIAEDPGVPVVVVGAQSLLSEELKARIQMKD